MKKRDCSWLWFIISLAIMLIFRLLPVPSGLTASGMQVLGILVGAIILWLTLGTTWTSAFVLFALCMVAVLEPVVIVCAIVYFLIGRLLWKPDVTPLANLDYDRLAASVGPMTKRQSGPPGSMQWSSSCGFSPAYVNMLLPALTCI